MDADEIFKQVEELEERVERLRSLYDQYFMGIEKIPPDVLKKDVERRIWIMRRERIRNTGVRFKFQSITQRLNTFNSYWMRICREIENGSFKRDVLRAKRRFGGAPQVVATAPVRDSEPPPEIEVSELTGVIEEIEMFGDDLLPEIADDETEQHDTTKLPGPMEVPPKAPPMPPPPRQPRPFQTSVQSVAPDSRGVIMPAPPSNPRPATVAARTSVQPASKPDPDAVARISSITARRVRTEKDLEAMFDALGSTEPPEPRSERMRPPPSQRQPPAGSLAPTSQVRPAVTAPTTSLAPAPEKSEADRRVYARYVEAKRKNGESTAGLTFEQLQRNLAKTRDKLKDRSGGRAIDFDVVVKDGKTVLKPVVK